jgi:hypothetical protein
MAQFAANATTPTLTCRARLLAWQGIHAPQSIGKRGDALAHRQRFLASRPCVNVTQECGNASSPVPGFWFSPGADAARDAVSPNEWFLEQTRPRVVV